MPGQRAKNKVPFGGFIDKKLHRKIIAAANKAGWRDNRFGFFLQLLTPTIDRRYRRLKAREKAHSALVRAPKPGEGGRTPHSAFTSASPRTKSRSPKSKKRA